MEENRGEILLYQTEDGQSRIEVTLSQDSVWLTADQMAELFGRNKSTISRHIKNVFESGEFPQKWPRKRPMTNMTNISSAQSSDCHR